MTDGQIMRRIKSVFGLHYNVLCGDDGTHLIFLFTFILITDLTFLILDCLTLGVVHRVANLQLVFTSCLSVAVSHPRCQEQLGISITKNQRTESDFTCSRLPKKMLIFYLLVDCDVLSGTLVLIHGVALLIVLQVKYF